MAPEKTKSSKIYGLRIFVIKLSLPLFLFFILFFKIALSLRFRINNTKVYYKILIRGGLMAPEKTKLSKILDNLHLFCQI
jgi:hypothetical protein